MKIAIVGSGISGLTAAWQLSEVGHEVTVFESRKAPAMLAHTAEFTLAGRPHTIDTLLIWRTYHTELTRLLDELGLGLDVFPMHSVSFSLEGQPAPYASYRSKRVGLLKRNLMLPRGRSAAETLEIGSCWFRHWLRALVKRRRVDAQTSIGDLFATETEDRYRRLIYPWLCGCFGFVPASVVRRTPASAMLEFQIATLSHSPQRVREGMTEFADRLLRRAELRVEHEVRKIGAADSAVGELRVEGIGPGGAAFSEPFDHAVLAVSPVTAGELVDRDREVWSSFEHSSITLYVHSDHRLMPRDRRHWSSVNYRLRDDAGGPIEETVWSNDVVPIAGDTEVFFSWNPIVPPREETVLYQAHLIRVLPAVEVQDLLSRRVPELQGRGNLWYCGTWAVPHRGSYLEEGVRSALEVASRLDASGRRRIQQAA